MPRKVRELIRDLESAGFTNRGGKGDHRDFVHPRVAKLVTVAVLMHMGSRLVSRLTGREGRSHRPLAYEAIYFASAFAIGVPPIYLFPNSDPLFYGAFWFLGVIVGILTAQALMGRRHA